MVQAFHVVKAIKELLCQNMERAFALSKAKSKIFAESHGARVATLAYLPFGTFFGKDPGVLAVLLDTEAMEVDTDHEAAAEKHHDAREAACVLQSTMIRLDDTYVVDPTAEISAVREFASVEIWASNNQYVVILATDRIHDVISALDRIQHEIWVTDHILYRTWAIGRIPDAASAIYLTYDEIFEVSDHAPMETSLNDHIFDETLKSAQVLDG